ncbi:L-fucose operon activator [Klebsiella pneumoniae]|uniref:L-fucose operon activator n=1 Tax=Klebsiella pneumoniae TaxID=573 RepID=A0A377WP24_KLEPN|nr:L-fucose operon activator [Klebsiella pneumoniae]
MKAARQQAIVDLLITHSSLTTETLSKQLNVSRETIRRDLSELQAQGKVLRNHGRAKVIHQRSQDSGDPFHMRLKSHYAHKADIAREALAWIDEGMVIALDASSTCWYLARQLPDRPLHVFTNSQPICQELAKRDQITLTCSGGTLQRKYGCYVKPGADFPAEIAGDRSVYFFLRRHRPAGRAVGLQCVQCRLQIDPA